MLVKSLFCALHCAVSFVSGMRVPTSVYVTTPSDEKTDLTPPAPTSISQFHKVASQEQFLYALHNVHFLPFDISDAHEDQDNTYKIYRPDPEDNPQFVDMEPPKITDEPNYYSVKPRKSKKYSKALEESKQKKQPTKEDKRSNESIRSDSEDDAEESQSENVEQQKEQDEQFDYSDSSVEQSPPASRLDFQMHGHSGPDTYKFGWDTGKGQFHIEEKDDQGDVYGKYQYVDDLGKIRKVEYSVKKNQGFRVL